MSHSWNSQGVLYPGEEIRIEDILKVNPRCSVTLNPTIGRISSSRYCPWPVMEVVALNTPETLMLILLFFFSFPSSFRFLYQSLIKCWIGQTQYSFLNIPSCYFTVCRSWKFSRSLSSASLLSISLNLSLFSQFYYYMVKRSQAVLLEVCLEISPNSLFHLS